MSKPLMALMMVTLLAPTFGWGQQPITFNVAHTNPAGSYSIGYGVHERAGGYIAFGLQNGDSTQQDLHTYMFDEYGQTLTVKGFSHPRLQWIGSVAPVAKLLSGGYAAGVSHFGSGSAISELHLYRFNEEGDTLWTRFLLADTTVAIRKCIETSNGDLLLTGLYEFPRGAFIYRLTADGDSVVFRNLGSPMFFAGSVSEDADGSLYVTGSGIDPGMNHNNDAFIVKLDANGNFLWRRHWPRFSGYNQAIPASDGGVVAIGGYSAPIPVWPQVEPTRALIVKYTSLGSQMWSYYPIQADQHERACYFADGFEQPDGNLVVCGVYRSNATLDRGMLFKFTAEGDELWRRFYRWYDGPFNGNEQIFNDVEPTSDGGFILTGSVERFVDTSYTHPAKLWLVKLDSLGCLVPGCHTVGIEEQALDLNEYLRIWPNPLPARQALQFSFEPPPTFTPNGALRVVLLDAMGRQVHEQHLGHLGHAERSEGVALAVTANLATGLYYLHLTDGTRWLAGGKVVVSAP